MRYSICVLSCVLIYLYFDICTSAGWRRWRRLWRGWIVIPTGIGVSVFTVLQWRRQSWNNQPQSTNASKNFQITCYRAIPLRAMSRAWGWISSQHVPLSIRCWLYTGYARMYGVNLEEAAHSLEHYNSLCEFFIRQLKEGVRPVAEYEPIVSPADGSIVNAGIVNSCNVEQIKGVTYTIKTFLGEPTWNELGRLKEKSDNDEANTLPSSQLQLTNGGGGGGGLRSQGDREHRPLYDESRRTPSKLLRLRHKNNDAVMNNLDNGGCELLHLGLNDAYQCNNEISADIKNDFRVLGWLVFYFQFCIKDLLINSFYIGFQIIYGIKSSIVLSNGKILKGASFLRSQFSFGNGTSTFNTRIDASTDTGLTYSTDCTTDCNDSSDDDDDDDMDEAKCYDPDWNEYKKQLLHNEDNELYQFVVYLAPGDYHRFHSPADLKIKFRRHFQGELLSVHPKIAQLIPELFSLNERAVYVGEWKHGFFSMVAVGATNVGSIKVHTDKDLLTNTRRWKHGPRFKDKELDVEWKKGEEVGEFRLGSTIVLLFEAPKDFHFSVKPDQKIRVGEPVTSFITEDSNYS